MSTEFQASVYAIVAEIPPGKVMTYGQIAAWLNRPRAARQVGYAMAACPRERQLPWHRVVNTHGEVSKRVDPADEVLQRELLEAEGISFNESGRLDLNVCQRLEV